MLQRAYSVKKDLTLSPYRYVSRFLLERLNKGILDPLYSSPFFWVKEHWDRLRGWEVFTYQRGFFMQFL